MTKLDWTHKDLSITDIRKLNELYVIKVALPLYSIEEKEIQSSLFVNEQIFEERLKSYFLKDNVASISREDILNIHWNMYITKGYYIKLKDGEITERHQDPNKYYVSYLEIAGPLGSFCSIYHDKELK